MGGCIPRLYRVGAMQVCVAGIHCQGALEECSTVPVRVATDGIDPATCFIVLICNTDSDVKLVGNMMKSVQREMYVRMMGWYI